MDYEIVDERDVILFLPIDQHTDTQASYEEFWSDPCWSEKE
jgi:hypothetical protein